MIEAQITWSNGRSQNYRLRGKQALYDVLVEQCVPERVAIEADSWSELAVVGETFQDDRFTIEIL